MDGLAHLSRVTHLEIRDIIDIGIVALLIYRILLFMKGTRGVQMTTALVFLVLFYHAARLMQLDMVLWIFTNSLSYIVFALIVIYLPEIRRGLTNIGRNPLLRRLAGKVPVQIYEEIVLAVTTLASKKTGGLIVIEREVGLKNYIETGIRLDAILTYDLLVNIFSPYAPLHDGAAIIQGHRVAAASCFLPLTLDPHLSKELGTRHRAAIGITEETDCIAIVVSEETGALSAAVRGKLFRNLDASTLREILISALEDRNGRVAQPVKENAAL